MCCRKLSVTTLANLIQKKSVKLFGIVKMYVHGANVHALVRGLQNRTRQTSMHSCAVRNELRLTCMTWSSECFKVLQSIWRNKLVQKATDKECPDFRPDFHSPSCQKYPWWIHAVLSKSPNWSSYKSCGCNPVSKTSDYIEAILRLTCMTRSSECFKVLQSIWRNELVQKVPDKECPDFRQTLITHLVKKILDVFTQFCVREPSGPATKSQGVIL
jgi:hypothetical protein